MVKSLLLLSLGVFISCQAVNTDTKAFFATDDNVVKKYAVDKVYPQGQLFPFSFYSTGGGSEKKRGQLLPEEMRVADQKKITASGVTMIGPQYELDKWILQDAKKFNVKAIYTLKLKIGEQKIDKRYLRRLYKMRKKLDTAKVREAVRKEIARVGDNDSIAWWNITPEELRFWRKPEMDFLKTVAQAVHDFDKKKRPVYLYDPGHVDARRMARSGKFTDIIGKGMYTNYSKMKNKRIFCRWSIEQELEAIKLIGDNNKVPIAVVEMFQQPPAKEIHLIESWARHDIYCAIATGAKGVLVFSASRRPRFPAREKYLDAYLEICRELQGELGQAVLFGKRKKDLTIDIISGPQSIKCKFYTHPEKDYFPISFANIAYKNSRYLIMVNSADKPVEAILDGLVYGCGITVQDVFDKTKRFTAPEGQIQLNFKPLQVIVHKISNTGE